MHTTEPLNTSIQPWNCIQESWRLIKDQYWLFMGIVLVGVLIMSVVPIVLIGPMLCGIFLCYLKKMSGQPVQFEMLFKGFDWFVPSLIAALIISAISLVFVVPMYGVMLAFMMTVIGSAESGDSQVMAKGMLVMMVLGYTVMYVLMMLISMLFMFTFQLIVDQQCTATEAIRLSIKGVLRNFWGMLGLLLVNMLIGMGGTLLCYVGAFFVIPIVYGSIVIAYRRVFPASEGLMDAVVPEIPGAAAPAG